MLNKIKNMFMSKRKDVTLKEDCRNTYSSSCPLPNHGNPVTKENDKISHTSNDDKLIIEGINCHSLANAFVQAIDQFGITILKDERIVHIINDFEGYKDCPYAKSILLTFIEEDRLSFINVLKNFEKTKIEERIIQEAAKVSMRHGYSQEFVKDTYVAILYALGRKDVFTPNEIVSQTHSSTPKEEKMAESSVKTKPTEVSEEPFVFNLNTIPFFQNYLITRNFLCIKMNGTKISEYEFEGFKDAFFKADFNGRKDVEFNVQSKEKDNTTTEVICFYASSCDPSKLKVPYREIVKYLDKTYGNPSVAEAGDVEAYLDWLNFWKENPYDESRYFLNLRAYILPEGTVCCSLQFNPTDYNLMFTLTPRAKEDQEKLQWRVSKPEPFELLFPMSSGDVLPDGSYDDSDDSYTDNSDYEDDNDVGPDTKQLIQIASTIACIISNTLQIPMEEIALDSTFIDLGMDSLDAVELIMELEKEYGITIPDEDAEQIVTLWDAASCVKWHLENY